MFRDFNLAWIQDITVDIRTILLENQDLELISKPSDGINGQEKLNNN